MADLLNQKFWRWGPWWPSEFWCTLKCENHWSSVSAGSWDFTSFQLMLLRREVWNHSSFLPHRSTAVNPIIRYIPHGQKLLFFFQLWPQKWVCLKGSSKWFFNTAKPASCSPLPFSHDTSPLSLPLSLAWLIWPVHLSWGGALLSVSRMLPVHQCS